MTRNTTDELSAQANGNGKALELFAGRSAQTFLDPEVWWWRDMMKAVNSIPPTHGHYAQWAAIKLAGIWWKQGWLPDDVGELAKLISTRKRTLEAHIDEAKLIMHEHFRGMIEDRPGVVEKRIERQLAGAAGGRAANQRLSSGYRAAKAPRGFAEACHFPEAETDTELVGLQGKAINGNSDDDDIPF